MDLELQCFSDSLYRSNISETMKIDDIAKVHVGREKVKDRNAKSGGAMEGVGSSSLRSRGERGLGWYTELEAKERERRHPQNGGHPPRLQVPESFKNDSYVHLGLGA